MNYLSNTLSFMYKLMSNRIMLRYENKKTKLKGDYSFEDVVNNAEYMGLIKKVKIKNDKNPYLFSYSIGYQIKENLEFNSTNEIIWGNNQEIEEYSPLLFRNIILDILENSGSEEINGKPRSYVIDVIESNLMNHYEYTLCKFVVEFKSRNDLYDGFKCNYDIIDTKFDRNIEDVFNYRIMAIAKLYDEISDQFINHILNAKEMIDDTKKFDRTLENLIISNIINEIEALEQKDIQGYPIYNILNIGMQNLIDSFYMSELYQLGIGPEAIDYYTDDLELEKFHSIADFVNNNLEFLDNLSKIQLKEYPHLELDTPYI